MGNLGYTVPLSYSGFINLVQVGPCPFDNPRSVVGVCNRLVGADVYYHFDLKYSLTKYLAYTPEVRFTILKRMSELVNIKSESFRGVVVHTLCPYPDRSFGDLFPEDFLKSMNVKIYDIATLSKYYQNGKIWRWTLLESLLRIWWMGLGSYLYLFIWRMWWIRLLDGLLIPFSLCRIIFDPLGFMGFVLIQNICMHLMGLRLGVLRIF